MALFDKKRLTLPTSMQFPVPPHTDGIILNKQTTRTLPSDSQQSYIGGQILRFKLQDQKAIDLQSIVLNFDLKTSADKVSVDDWVGSIFRTVTVSFNGHQIERIDHYNRLHNALASFSVDEGYRQSVFGDMEGYIPKTNSYFGDVSDFAATADGKHQGSQYRNMTTAAIPAAAEVLDDLTPKGGILNGIHLLRRFAHPGTANNVTKYGCRDKTANREYSVHFDLSGFLGRFRKLFWLPLINSLDIEIQLAENSEVLNDWNTPIAAQTYTLSSPHIQAEMYTLSQEYVNALSLSLQQQGLTVNFDTYEVRPLDLNAGNSQQIVLNTRLSSLKSIYLWFYQPYKGADAEALETKRIDRTWSQQRILTDDAGTGKVTLKSYQLFIDGRPIQAHPISTTDAKYSEALWELMKSLRIHGDVTSTPLVSADTYINRGKTTNTTSGLKTQFLSEEHFLLGIDLEKSDLLSGHSVANQLYFNLEFEGANLGTGARMYTVLHHDKNVIIYPGLTFEERI